MYYGHRKLVVAHNNPVGCFNYPDGSGFEGEEVTSGHLEDSTRPLPSRKRKVLKHLGTPPLNTLLKQGWGLESVDRPSATCRWGRPRALRHIPQGGQLTVGHLQTRDVLATSFPKDQSV